MSYIINNSRGNVVAIIADGTVNTTATDLALVGRAVTNYGTSENENYVYLLENFANSTAPLLNMLPPVTLPATVINPAVVMLPPVINPAVVMLLPVTLPVADTSPPVNKLPPVMFPTVVMPLLELS